MAKHNCAICGAEIGLVSEKKLADNNYICRKTCAKKCMKLFDTMTATLDQVNSHIDQVDFGTKAWNQILVPLLKTKNKDEKIKRFGKSGSLYVSQSTGLMAVVETNYKFIVFGKSQKACVYRIADLYRYNYETETSTNSEGKEEIQHFCRLGFDNVQGMYDVRLPIISSGEFNSMEKYFNKIFGIQKTLGNVANTFKRQIDAVKSVTEAVKSYKDGEIDQAAAENAIGAVNTMQYGDRTELIAKADASLARVQR